LVCRREEVAEVYNTPLLDLVYHAASVHRMYNDPSMVGSAGGRSATL
jgi:biotin synthase